MNGGEGWSRLRRVGWGCASQRGTCEGQQVSERGGADLGPVLEQSFVVEEAGADGDDGEGVGVGGLNVARRVADDADGGVGPGERAGFEGGVRDELGAVREIVTESAEAEPLAESGLFNFDPADHFEVAGGDAEKGALLRRGGRRASSMPGMRTRVNLVAALGDGLADGFKDGVDLGFEDVGGDAGQAAGFAQDCRYRCRRGW